jgi:MoaD family protein
MKIVVKGYLTLKSIIGGSAEVQMPEDNGTLIDLLNYLASKHGENFNQAVFDAQTNTLSSHAKILVNGRHYTHLPLRLETELHDGDEVSLFPMVAGG